MTTFAPRAKTYGRVRATTPARPVEDVNLSDPRVVRAIVQDATKVARAEQAKRRKTRSI
jgi:hypothetical protein